MLQSSQEIIMTSFFSRLKFSKFSSFSRKDLRVTASDKKKEKESFFIHSRATTFNQFIAQNLQNS